MGNFSTKCANFGVFCQYSMGGLWDNRFVNWIRYDILGGAPPRLFLVRNIGNIHWIEAYQARLFGWRNVLSHGEWDYWMFRIGDYALECTYLRRRLVVIRRYELY